VPRAVDRSEVGQQRGRGPHRLARRRRDEREVVARRAPGRELERQAGQVDLVDLGGSVGSARAVLDLAPEPVAGAGLDPPRASGSLIGRGAARGDRRQTRHAGSCVEPWRPRQTGVDDDPHAVDGQRRLGDVGRQHDPSTPGRRGVERTVLFDR
jgi:hypothetical protein